MADQPQPSEQPAQPDNPTPPPAVPDTEYRAGRPFVFTDVAALEAAIKKYFDERDPHTEKVMQRTGENKVGEPMYGLRETLTEQKHYTVTGLARALGVERHTLRNYRKYEHYSDAIPEATKQGLITTIADAFQRVEEYNEEGLHVPGRANGIKFNLVNNFDWQDKTISETRNPAEDLNDLDDEVDERDKIAEAAAAALAADPPPAAEAPQTEPGNSDEPPGSPPTE